MVLNHARALINQSDSRELVNLPKKGQTHKVKEENLVLMKIFLHKEN